MWASANKTLPARVAGAVACVRAFRETESLHELTQDCLADNEYLGWELRAVAAKLLHAKGAYRCPADIGFVYFVFLDSGLQTLNHYPTPD